MSLRRRLFTLLLLSCVALAASVVGTTRLMNLGVGAREASAASAGSRAVFALAGHLDEGLEAADGALIPVLEDLARSLEDGTVGVCGIDGAFLAERTTRGAARPLDGPDLLPLDGHRVLEACRAATREPKVVRSLAPTDVLTIATLRTRGGVGPIAFALARVPRQGQRVSPLSLALLALAGLTTAALVALTAHGAWVLRASTSSLATSLEALSRDLRAPIPEPRAVELATVAAHLRNLAATLADAQERERSLSRDVEEQRRLAGLGRVVAGVAHEVRNPLAGLKLRLDAMSMRSLDSRSRGDVERCLGEVERLDRLVRALLLASRRRVPKRLPFDAGVMLDERIALAAAIAEPAGVSIEREGEATLAGEREDLCGVVDNLLRNAIEASPRGGRVRVCVARAEGEGSARIDVIDAGPGVPTEHLGELFEPFFSTKGQGTGLGLVIARATVEAHGGTLTYERREAVTVFSVIIPNGANDGGAPGHEA